MQDAAYPDDAVVRQPPAVVQGERLPPCLHLLPEVFDVVELQEARLVIVSDDTAGCMGYHRVVGREFPLEVLVAVDLAVIIHLVPVEVARRVEEQAFLSKRWLLLLQLVFGGQRLLVVDEPSGACHDAGFVLFVEEVGEAELAPMDHAVREPYLSLEDALRFPLLDRAHGLGVAFAVGGQHEAEVEPRLGIAVEAGGQPEVLFELLARIDAVCVCIVLPIPQACLVGRVVQRAFARAQVLGDLMLFGDVGVAHIGQLRAVVLPDGVLLDGDPSWLVERGVEGTIGVLGATRLVEHLKNRVLQPRQVVGVDVLECDVLGPFQQCLRIFSDEGRELLAYHERMELAAIPAVEAYAARHVVDHVAQLLLLEPLRRHIVERVVEHARAVRVRDRVAFHAQPLQPIARQHEPEHSLDMRLALPYFHDQPAQEPLVFRVDARDQLFEAFLV